MVEKLPKSKIFVYAIGQMGWSILVNIVSLQLVYFYIPPQGSGLTLKITQTVFLVVLNALTLIAASGRIFDAITDPIIANLSDRWHGKRGRRVPFMLVGAAPAAIFCTLMFVPIVNGVSSLNIVWLFFMQVLFYLFLTIYVTPFFALLPELGHTSNEKLNLSTWISVTYALGIVVASMVPSIAGIFGLEDKTLSLQLAIGLVSFIAMILMLIPAIFLNEKKYATGEPSSVPLFKALKSTFKNISFKYYVVADFSYFMGLTIVMTGLLYYITVLLGLSDDIMGILLPLMVFISFIFYPVVNILAKKVGKKPLIVGSFFFMGIIFFFIFFMGKLPISEKLQAFLVVILYSIPLSFLGVLPNAVLADIAEFDAKETGVNQEGMFFAARTLMQKFGQTFGVLSFAALTSLGKDPGNDLGIRISGLLGFGLCIFAGSFFIKYNEKKIIGASINNN
ncbi:MAG: MFS transporter [Spirochaetales bacterium]|nr:MFS transporter [Spirochaetales bacterium]